MHNTVAKINLNQWLNLGPGAFYRDIPIWRLRAVKKQLQADGCTMRIRYKAPNMFDAPKWLASHFNVYIDGSAGLKLYGRPQVGKAIHLQIDTKAFKEHCSQLDSFAKDLLATAFVKAIIAEKEAGL